jgi:homogentisate 1,2-dioxygenase
MPLKYQSGFGNTFSTEAVKGALPRGQNSPQKTPRGLYTEVVSGTAFTAPRAENLSAWLYKLRPSAMHAPYRRIANGLVRSGPFDEAETPPNRLRWDPLPIPAKPTDFIDGLVTFAGSGAADSQHGVAVHVYRANRAMKNRYFYNADGEMMFVPQEGAIELFTELGRLEVAPGEIAVVPRGIKFKVLVSGATRGYVCENYGAPFRLPELGPIGSQGLAQVRDFLAPVAAFEEKSGKCEVVAKFMGGLWASEFKHSPLDVVAWHGDYTPYKYDLARFMAINTVSFDHADPSIFRAHLALGPGGRRQLRLRHLPAALGGGRAHLPPALVPSQRDERADGPRARRLRRQVRRLPARRRVDPQLHERARHRPRGVPARLEHGAEAPQDREQPRLHVGVALRLPAHQGRPRRETAAEELRQSLGRL